MAYNSSSKKHTAAIPTQPVSMHKNYKRYV